MQESWSLLHSKITQANIDFSANSYCSASIEASNGEDQLQKFKNTSKLTPREFGSLIQPYDTGEFPTMQNL